MPSSILIILAYYAHASSEFRLASDTDYLRNLRSASAADSCVRHRRRSAIIGGRSLIDSGTGVQSAHRNASRRLMSILSIIAVLAFEHKLACQLIVLF